MKNYILAGAVALMAMPAQATTLTDIFDSFYVLGDSLSDNGNTATMVARINALPGNGVPFPPGSPLQQPGVSSDGFTWAKEFTDAFGAVPGKSTTNLSFGAARASNNMDGPPDLADQIATDEDFTTSFDLGEGVTITGTVPKYPDGAGGLLSRIGGGSGRELVTVFIGGNDFLDTALSIGTKVAIAGATGGTPPTEEEIALEINALVTNTLTSVLTGIQQLTDNGVKDLLVFNLPNFAVIPQFQGVSSGLGALLGQAALTYNGLLEDELDLLRLSGVAVTSVDFFGLLTEQVTVNPLGLDVFTTCQAAETAAIESGGSLSSCEGYLFFDNIHPTQTGHSLLADAARIALDETYATPVPLPAPMLMLLSALGGLAVIRRKRAA